MVLHHVARRAVFVVIAEAPLDPERLGHGDLHMIDGVAVPQRLEQRVGETERDEVLDRLLAEIVVDPEGPLLAEMLGDGVVDRLAGLAALADRLFDDDAVGLDRQALRREALHDGGVEGRRGRQVEQRLAGIAKLFLQSRHSSSGRRHRRRHRTGAWRTPPRLRPRRTPPPVPVPILRPRPGIPSSDGRDLAAPMMRRPSGSRPSASRKYRDGNSMRRARSPVAPNMTKAPGAVIPEPQDRV